jgi:hypothetical protein
VEALADVRPLTPLLVGPGVTPLLGSPLLSSVPRLCLRGGSSKASSRFSPLLASCFPWHLLACPAVLYTYFFLPPVLLRDPLPSAHQPRGLLSLLRCRPLAPLSPG